MLALLAIIIPYALGFAMAAAFARRYALSVLELVFFGFVCATAHAVLLPVFWTLNPSLFVASTLASSAASWWLSSITGTAAPREPLPPAIITTLVLILAVIVRLTNLGIAEFQGDEVRALRLAAKLPVEGLSVLMQHKKGPAEILLPAIPVMLGERSEFLLRLPFALAGIGTVIGVLLLGVRLFSPAAAAIAALIMALDGFGIAFSRIVQYQSVVLLFSIAAVYLVLVRRALIPAALCIALAAWGHFDFVFCLPPIVFAVVWRFILEHEARRQQAKAAAKAAVVSLLVAGAFYLPFVLHPHFKSTLAYVQKNRVGNSLLYNNFADFFTRVSIYNASYFIIAVLLLAAVSLALTSTGKRWGWAAFIACLAIASTILTPGIWNVHGLRFTLIPWVLLGLFALDTRRSLAWRCCLLWFLGIFITAAFLVEKPVTHFYPQVPPLALLAGYGSILLLERLRTGMRPVAFALAGLLIAVSLYHQYTVFLRPSPEYWDEYPAAKLGWYWTPFTDIPQNGYFGFPHRIGLRTVRELVHEGKLPADGLRSNADNTAVWYLPESVKAVEPQTYIFFEKPHGSEADLNALQQQFGPLISTLIICGKPTGYLFSRTALKLPREIAAE